MEPIVHLAIATAGRTFDIAGDSAVSPPGALSDVTIVHVCISRSISHSQLIRDIGVTHGDDSRVGYYVGLIVSTVFHAYQILDLKISKHSLFFITQAVTIFSWGRASDHIGRKPIVLIGVAGLSISMYCVGLSRTFWGLAFRYLAQLPMPYCYRLTGVYVVAV